MSVICCESLPTRAWTSCRLSERPWVCWVMVSMRAPVLAWTSCTDFCSEFISPPSLLTESSDCWTSVLIVALLLSTALRRSCCACKIWLTDCCSSIISFETAPAGCGASSAPPSAPRNTAASTSTIHRVRKRCLLGETWPRTPDCGVTGAVSPARVSEGSVSIADAGASEFLVCHDEVRAAILLPARFVMLGAERALFAPARCFHAVRRDAERNQVVLRGFGASLAQTQVVFRGSALVAMAFDGDVNLRIGTQELGIFGQSGAGVLAQIGLIELEVRILDVLVEQVAHVRRRKVRRPPWE